MSYVRGIIAGCGHNFTTFHPWSVFADNYPGAATAAGAWPTANLAIYVPIVVPVTITVVSLALANGGTVSGNFDLGIYSATGARLVSTGSTAQSGASSEQVVDITDTTLAPGLYWLAANMDNTTATVFRVNPSAPLPLAYGVLSEAVGAVTLPTTATFAADQTLAYVPLVMAFVETTVT